MANKRKLNFQNPNREPIKIKETQTFRLWILSCIIAIVVFLVYKSSFSHEFVNWDDQVYVEEQPLVLNKHYSKLWKIPISLNYHPLTMSSLAVQVPERVENLNAGSFIKWNVWIHIVNSILVMFFILGLCNKNWIVSFLTAMVFAVHPMHVESVVWVSERKDVLYTFFLLLSCLAYLAYIKKWRGLWLWIAGLFFIFSVLSKAVAVIIPLIWILLDYIKGRSMKDYKLWLEKLPFLGVSLFFGLMAVSVQGGKNFGGILTLYGEKTVALAADGVFTLWQRFQFASYGFVQYLVKFFSPMEISPFYPYPPGNILSGFGSWLYPSVFVLVLLIGIFSLKKYKLVSFGIGFYFITVALVLQFMSVGQAIMADRYTYVPYIGLAFMIFYVTHTWCQQKGKLYQYGYIGVAVIFCIILVSKTASQIDVWKNSETLWSKVLSYYPNDDLALANRGNHRGKTGNIVGAMADFERAISDGCERADVYEGLGNSYGTLSDQHPDRKQELVDKAIAMYKQAIVIDPNKGNIFYNLGIAQIQTNPEASIQAFTDAQRLMPYKENEILHVLGMSQINARKYDDAVTTLSKAISSGIVNDKIFVHRGLAYSGIGNTSLAKKDFAKALEINPNNQEAQKRSQE